MSTGFDFPDGARFAFAIIDDTDGATLENVRPVYDLLRDLGLRATKTVWPVDCPEGSRKFGHSDTLEQEPYRDFVLDLRDAGFEIAWHCATMKSSTRERTQQALERFAEIVGIYPRVHANHSYNRENLYWGMDRIDDAMLRRLYGRFVDGHRYLGHVDGSEYWWGDLCREHIVYARNLTFSDLDVSSVNPSMPYVDPLRPWVRFWFSATDAQKADDFVRVCAPERLDRLEQAGGVCILATHFGMLFTADGEVVPNVRARFEDLASRPGWFPTVGELLDWLRARRTEHVLPAAEWRRMQWRWVRDLLGRAARMERRNLRRRLMTRTPR